MAENRKRVAYGPITSPNPPVTTTGPTIVPNGPVVTTTGSGGPVVTNGGGGGDGGLQGAGNWVANRAAEAPSGTFVFTVESFEIDNTRSRHEDTDYVSCTLAVGSGAPQTRTKFMGDLNNGTFQVGLSFGPVTIAPKEAAIFNYLILNSGHQSQQATQDALTKAGTVLAQAGAQAAAEAIASGASALVGAEIGSAVLPVIGTVLGAIAGWLVGQLGGLLFANCDGPVAAEQIAVTGAQLAAQTANGLWQHTTTHPGTDSPHGCGSNSLSKVTWKI